MNAFAMSIKNRHGFPAIAGGKDPIVKGFQGRSSCLQDRGFVIHQKNSFAFSVAGDLGQGSLAFLVENFQRGGQKHMKPSASFYVIYRLDKASMIFDDSHGGGQTQS